MTVTEEIKRLEVIFDKLNEKFYAGKLTRPVIQYSNDPSNKMYGFFTVQKNWEKGEEHDHEICICANSCRGEHVYSTMLHEMAHYYNSVNEIDDTSNNGFYHNKRFKATCEAHGLICNKNKYGWSDTSLTPEAREFCVGLPKLEMVHTGFHKNTEGEDGEEPKEKTKKSFKYVCPRCGEVIRSKNPNLRVVCYECDEEFMIED